MKDRIDVAVGKLIKKRRRYAKLSQKEVAEGAGVTFQQIQKYESGANRVSASRLWKISEVLDVPVEFFFAEYAGNSSANQKSRDWRDNPEVLRSDEKAVTLLETYFSMPEYQRQKLIKLINVLTEAN